MWDIHRCYWAMSLTEVLSARQPMGVARYIKVIVSITYDTYFRRVSASRDILDGDGACARDTMKEEGVTEGRFIPDSEGGTRRRS